MKNYCKSISKFSMAVLVASMLIIITTACEPPEVGPGNPAREYSYSIGPDGGIINALSGNVLLEIPAGTLDSQVIFSVKEGMEDYDGDFVMKSIEIRPRDVVFKHPVILKLKYNGQLSNGMDPSSAISLVIYHFENEAAYDKRNPNDMIWINKCYVAGDHCIETKIYSGGVFAIGEESLGQPANTPQ